MAIGMTAIIMESSMLFLGKISIFMAVFLQSKRIRGLPP